MPPVNAQVGVYQTFAAPGRYALIDDGSAVLTPKLRAAIRSQTRAMCWPCRPIGVCPPQPVRSASTASR